MTIGKLIAIITFLSIVTLVVIGSKESVVDKAANDLTLHYLNNNIYPAVDCRGENVDGVDYILCSAVSLDGVGRSNPGGLYKVETFNSTEYKLYAVNGKAKGHSSKGIPPIAEDLYNTKIDISAIIDKFY